MKQKAGVPGHAAARLSHQGFVPGLLAELLKAVNGSLDKPEGVHVDSF
ncbi:hypothetical protein [Deinococcus deserti]|nr:hypothetical protein [Deinococcus deserti]